MTTAPTQSPTTPAEPPSAPTAGRGTQLALIGLALVVGLVVTGDQVVVRLRRRARQAPTPSTTAAPTPTGPPAEALELPPTTPVAAEEQEMPPIEAAPVQPESEPPPPTPTSAARDVTGQTIGPYRLLEKIGQGGMAEIYKAYHPTLNRYAAVKVMRPGLTDSGDLVARFQREAQTVAALRHPNIVQVFDFGFLDGRGYLIMEYVEGASLQEEMRRRQLADEPWQPDEILHVVGQVADALDYAHRRGVVHRDVKPGNVLLAADNHAILTDFGLSALRRGRSTLISTLGQPFGTPEYVAPEQAMDYRAAVAQSDQYSVGCIVYEMITGHLVFEAPTPLALALMHVTQDPIPPSHYVPDLPSLVEAVILKTLGKEPDRRFPTVRAMVDRLRQAWMPTTPKVPPTEPAPPIQSPPASEIGEEEARLVLWAADNANGFLSRPVVCQQLRLPTDWQARRILEAWTASGWLIRPASRKLGYQVTDELIRLARRRLGEPDADRGS